MSAMTARRLFCFTALAIGALLPTSARAQEPAEAQPLPPPASPCALGPHEGVAEPDANTTARLVCAEVAKRGPAPALTYRVVINKLGNLLILVLQSESPPGTVRDQRQLRLASIEEVPRLHRGSPRRSSKGPPSPRRSARE